MRSTARPTLATFLPAAAIALLTGASVALLALSRGAYDLVDRQTAGVLLWWLVGVGALVVPAAGRRPALAGVLTIAFGALIPLWIAVTISGSLSHERSATELARDVVHLAPLVLIGWVLPARSWRPVLFGAALGATLITIGAFIERLSPGFLGEPTAIVFGNTTARLAQPLGYWNAVGSWAVINALMLLALSSHLRSTALRALTLAPVPLIIGVAYVTYSRSAIASGVLAAIVLLALSRNRWTLAAHAAAGLAGGLVLISTITSNPEIADATGTIGRSGVAFIAVLAAFGMAAVAAITGRFGLDEHRLPEPTGRRAGLGATAAGVALIVVGLLVKGGDLWDRFQQTDSQASGADRLSSLGNGIRVDQWRAAWDAWQDAPLRGHGAGTFELIWNRVPGSGFVRDAHSAFLEALAEQGLVGFLLLAGFAVSAVAVVLVARRRATSSTEFGLVAGAGAGIVAFLGGSSFDWFWEVTALPMLMLALLAALIASTRPGARGEAEQEPASGRTPIAWRLAIAALAAVAVLVQLPGLVGTSEVRRSQRAVTAQDYDAARSHADQAIEIMPWASSPFLQRALVDERTGAWRSARRSIQLAVERDPYDWRLPLVQSRIEAEAGRPRAALRAYRKAKALRPLGEFFR